MNVRGIGLQTLDPASGWVDPLVYPLLFPNGEQGWTEKIPITISLDSGTARKSNSPISRLQFYSHRLAIRDGFSILHASEKLFQQFIVDAYVRVEGSYLKWVRDNQAELRVDTYKGLSDYVLGLEDDTSGPAGKRVILPSTFAGT